MVLASGRHLLRPRAKEPFDAADSNTGKLLPRLEDPHGVSLSRRCSAGELMLAMINDKINAISLSPLPPSLPPSLSPSLLPVNPALPVSFSSPLSVTLSLT